MITILIVFNSIVVYFYCSLFIQRHSIQRIYIWCCFFCLCIWYLSRTYIIHFGPSHPKTKIIKVIIGSLKNYKGGGALKRPAPLCRFLRSQNSSNCCLSLVFVGFNFLILCWLAGANDEVHYFKFNPYFLTFETLGIFQKAAKNRYGPKIKFFLCLFVFGVALTTKYKLRG